jgi:hypothetical protein
MVGARTSRGTARRRFGPAAPVGAAPPLALLPPTPPHSHTGRLTDLHARPHPPTLLQESAQEGVQSNPIFTQDLNISSDDEVGWWGIPR